MKKSTIVKLAVLFLIAVIAVILAISGAFDWSGEGSSSATSSSSSKQQIITHIHSWQDATCEAPKTCSGCGATEGEKLEHSYVNGVCEHCGITLSTEENDCLYLEATFN